MNSAMFSSQNNEWETPQAFFDKLDEEFHFDIDVCALPHNTKCEKYYSPDDDGLKQHWNGRCWMNPPYGRSIGEWMRKAYEESRGGIGCMLNPIENRYVVVA